MSKSFLNRRLSAVELCLAVLIVALVGAVGYLVFGWAADAALAYRIARAMPAIRAQARLQRQAIETALEAYRAQFGTYPPDHIVNQQPLVVDPVTNTLMYELAGTLWDRRNNKVQVAGLEPADLAYVSNFLHCATFRNITETPAQPKQFLQAGQVPWRQLHDDPDVFALGFWPGGEAVPSEIANALEYSTWRYVRSAPTNNPGKYDLWVEITGYHQRMIVGNWKAVE